MTTLLRTALLLGAAASLGLLLGRLAGPHWGWGTFTLIVLALLAHHLRQFHLLARWVAASPSEPVPEGSGAWIEVFTGLHRRRRDQIQRRGRIARLLARSMQAGRALPYGVTVLDADMRITWCNDSAQAHFSLGRGGDIGQPIINLIRQPAFKSYIDARDFSEPLEFDITAPGELTLSIQLVPFVESHHLLLSRDITQGRKLQIMRRDFVANVSHELRTPLTVLVGFLETVRELKLDAERTRAYLNLMAEQGHRMQRIIEDLLMLSTLESAPQPPADERVDMAAVLAQVRAEAASLSAGVHEFHYDIEPGLDLLGSDKEISSALGNLVNNAVRYTPSGGHIKVQWHATPEGAEFSVTDDGPGIAAEHIPRLTERFYRVDRGRSRETGGTGLGLAIVKHALARHDAPLSIQSSLGQGSRFSTLIPLRRITRSTAPIATGAAEIVQ